MEVLAQKLVQAVAEACLGVSESQGTAYLEVAAEAVHNVYHNCDLL